MEEMVYKVIRVYTFQCYEENGGCGKIFETTSTKEEISSLKPTCPNCRKRKSVFRNYRCDLAIYVSDPKTLGMLAEKNTETMSDDEKNRLKLKHTEYLRNKERRPLPEGMSYATVDTRQREKDPKKTTARR